MGWTIFGLFCASLDAEAVLGPFSPFARDPAVVAAEIAVAAEVDTAEDGELQERSEFGPGCCCPCSRPRGKDEADLKEETGLTELPPLSP